MTSRNAQAAQGTATLLVVPLAFVSAAYVPADMLPGWMQPVTDKQPFTIVSNAARSLTVDGSDAVGLRPQHRLFGGAEPCLVRRDPGCIRGAIAVSRFARQRQQTDVTRPTGSTT